MDSLIRTPAKPKQPHGDTHTAHHRTIQAVFWVRGRLASRHGLSMLLLVDGSVDDDAGEAAEEHADEDGQEC